MRPDNYRRIVEAYYYKEQKSWLPFRKLYNLIGNMLSSEENSQIKEQDFIFLPMIDTPPPPKKQSKPLVLTAEQKREKAIRAGLIKE
jgi:Asp-tRNA(Asn)/Glu-tRNA(Gln) amidotransferase A subunit family amidase